MGGVGVVRGPGPRGGSARPRGRGTCHGPVGQRGAGEPAGGAMPRRGRASIRDRRWRRWGSWEVLSYVRSKRYEHVTAFDLFEHHNVSAVGDCIAGNAIVEVNIFSCGVQYAGHCAKYLIWARRKLADAKHIHAGGGVDKGSAGSWPLLLFTNIVIPMRSIGWARACCGQTTGKDGNEGQG